MIASLSNLAGPDLIVIFLILSVFGGGPLVAIILLVRYLNRKRPVTEAGLSTIVQVEERIRKLDELKVKGRITSAEYESQRQRIISQV
jgi:hypothetical protein